MPAIKHALGRSEFLNHAVLFGTYLPAGWVDVLQREIPNLIILRWHLIGTSRRNLAEWNGWPRGRHQSPSNTVSSSSSNSPMRTVFILIDSTSSSADRCS